MYKLLAMDLDETLFNDNHQVDKENRVWIKQAKDAGIKIVPCSGRGPGFLGTLYQDLDLNYDHEYSILANGAVVIENKSNKVISRFGLTYEKAKELLHYGLERNICVQLFTTSHVYMYNINEDEYERVKHFGNNIILMKDNESDFLKDDVILKVLYERSNSMEFFQNLAKEMEDITKDDITISFSSNRYLELNAKGIHKGIGLQALAAHLNIDISETIGVGDNYNDIGLIESAGLGVAVKNAIPEIKEIADITLDVTNNESAIADVIKNYIFKEE